VIVTGASSGIGEALVRQLVARGARVLMVARRAERLAELAAQLRKLPSQVEFVPGDVTVPDCRRECLETVAQRWGGLDLLINNAGVGALGPFADAAPERLRQIMEVNFFAPAELLREALPLLKQGERPMVVNIGSVLGHCAVPDKSEYCAAKFALHGLSDAVRIELRAQGIDLLLVSPSTTRSEFFARVIDGDGTREMRRPGMSPARVAELTLRAVEAGKREVILSWGGKLLVWADRMVPSLVDRLLTRYYRDRDSSN
jgi:short-subunit dehydrogenase